MSLGSDPDLSAIPAMLAAVSLEAFGEALGYVVGGSRHGEELADELELHERAYAARGRG